jgi:hypothetical protein
MSFKRPPKRKAASDATLDLDLDLSALQYLSDSLVRLSCSFVKDSRLTFRCQPLLALHTPRAPVTVLKSCTKYASPLTDLCV